MRELVHLPSAPIMVRPPILEGEILPPGETIQITAAMHPFKMAAQVVEMPVGSSIAEIVETCGRECQVSRLASGAAVEINGHLIPKEIWHCVRVKAGAHVLVRALPGKAVGGIFKSILQLALVVAATFALGPAGLGLSAPFAAAGAALVPISGRISRGLFSPSKVLEEK